MVGGPAAGQRIGGRYRIVERIGRGGMGSVFRTEDEPSGRPLAVKVLAASPRIGERHHATLRFQREFHTVARLRHPRVVEVYDFGVDPVFGPFYSMELLDGEDLSARGPTDPVRACQLLHDVTAALAFLHDRRLLHRDLCGRNVRCTSDGRAKLIDFGVLATIGSCAEVAGTPPYMAPEALRGLPLDARTDLFGLGALAYRLLAGRDAYPAARMRDLEELWFQRVPPVSTLRPEIPPALNELVMSLLNLDRSGRPSSAVAVIDQLSAIAGLPALDEPAAAHGYLASAALVGRRREMELLRERLTRASHGRGSSVVVEGDSGVGKSRLLRELRFEAQVAGALVLQADSDDAVRGTFGVVKALARDLLAAGPEAAGALAWPGAPELLHLVPELAAVLDGVEPADTDPRERRPRLQSALIEWFTAVARARPLTLCVDDVQRCDESSAAVLAALARRAADLSLLITASFRTAEEVRAPAAVAALRDASERIRLKGLDRHGVQDLVEAMFGRVPNAGHLAAWIDRRAGGIPLLCTELARRLVEDRVVKLVEGVWVTPDEIRGEDMPTGLAEAMSARVAALTPDARSLAEALSVFGGEFSLDQVSLVAEPRTTSALFDALDELIDREVLLSSGAEMRFRHDGLREALLAQLDGERRRRLHRHVGETLLELGEMDAAREVEIGWHLVRGDSPRGVELLTSGGRKLFEAWCFAEAIPPLEGALEALTRQRAPAWKRLELGTMLLMAGLFLDRDTALRHLDEVVAGHARYTGMNVARLLRRFLGRAVGLASGLLFAQIRWLVTWPVSRGPNPIRLMPAFLMNVGAAATSYLGLLDPAGSRRMEALAEPFSLFTGRFPSGLHLVIRHSTLTSEGRLAAVRPLAARALEIIQTDRKTPIPDIDRKILQGAEIMWLALVDVLEQDPAYLDEVRRFEALNVSLTRIAICQILALHHRLRGEESEAHALEAELELLRARFGTYWSADAYLASFSLIGQGVLGDAMAMKRAVERLAALEAGGCDVGSALALARGEYYRLRGQLEASEAALRPVMDAAPDEQRLAWAIAPAALAETLLGLGRPDEAADAARRALEINQQPERRQPIVCLRAERALALAEAAAGESEAAARRLERAIAAQGEHNPALAGVLHEARARVALLTGDLDTFRRHGRKVDECFHATGNPALIARARRLTAAGTEDVVARAPARVVGVDVVTTPYTAETSLESQLDACTGPGQELVCIHELLLDQSAAGEAYLYLMGEDGSISLVAPEEAAEPPGVRDEVERALADASAGEVTTEVDDPRRRTGRKVVVLAPRGRAVLGAAVLVEGALPLEELPADLVRRLSDLIAKHGLSTP